MSIASNSSPAPAENPPAKPVKRFSNNWPTVPLRLFLSAIFLFGSYAKFTYPGFFDPNASFGFRSSVQSARHGTPLGGLMGPLSDHASVFGHITAVAELLIGLGLLVGLLTRIAALGGMVLVIAIVLSIDWPEVKEYTGNGGWFTSVDLAVAAALSVFLLGGAGPLSLDGAIGALRSRRRAKAEREEVDPRYSDPAADLEDSRRRLRGEDDASTGFTGPIPTPGSNPGWNPGSPPAPTPNSGPGAGPGSGPGSTPGSGPGAAPGSAPSATPPDAAAGAGSGPPPAWPAPPNATQQLPTVPSQSGAPVPSGDEGSLWNPPRRESDQ